MTSVLVVVSYPGKFQNPLAWAPPLVFYRVVLADDTLRKWFGASLALLFILGSNLGGVGPGRGLRGGGRRGWYEE